MKKNRNYITGYRLSIILTALLAGGVSLSGCGKDKRAGATSSRGAAIQVDALVIHPQLLESKIISTGTLLANEEVELRSEISGRITGIYFDEGSRVSKGELLIKINDRELRAQLERKELEEKLATEETARKRGLYEIKGISQEEFDKTINNLKMIQAEKEIIQSQIAEAEITAPFDGVIGLRYVSLGGYVTSNTLMARMQDIDPIKVEFSVPEKYARQISQGTPIEITVGDSQTKYSGTVYAVESKIDLSTRTIKARARIANRNGELIPGSFANIKISLARIIDAIVVPTEAIIPEMNGEKVFIAENGKARSVPVKTGIRTDSSIQITQGLNPNDTLVITGLLQISNGKAIEIKNIKAD